MTNASLLYLSDSYKYTHAPQYPANTSEVYSYLEPRFGAQHPASLQFGLHYFVKEYLSRVPRMWDVMEAHDFFAAHFGNPRIFNYKGWSELAKMGYLPIEIKAVAEGTLVPTGNVLMTIRNTDPRFFWLTNYLETLLVQMWYPITVATNSYFCRQTIAEFMDATAGHRNGLEFKLHDFGFRGVSSPESAGLGGAAHLINFMGTDTVIALKFLKEYYQSPMAGFSIPASEHSTITSWGKEHEYDAFQNMLTQYPDGLVACVSDSYDIEAACNAWASEPLRSQILNRKGTLVVRPDSGDPATTVLLVLETLAKGFTPTVNNKGFRVLPDCIRVIQGDGVTPTEIRHILGFLKNCGWSAENVAFGMGGGLLQQVNRDNLRFAFKCSSITIDGVEQDVQKMPKSDPSKASKAGKLALVKDDDGRFQTVKLRDLNGRRDFLNTVFLNGVNFASPTFAEIRERAASGVVL